VLRRVHALRLVQPPYIHQNGEREGEGGMKREMKVVSEERGQRDLKPEETANKKEESKKVYALCSKTIPRTTTHKYILTHIIINTPRLSKHLIFLPFRTSILKLLLFSKINFSFGFVGWTSCSPREC
jgi:hypothetical protein